MFAAEVGVVTCEGLLVGESRVTGVSRDEIVAAVLLLGGEEAEFEGCWTAVDRWKTPARRRKNSSFVTPEATYSFNSPFLWQIN